MNIAKARRISDPPNTLSLTVACKGGKKLKINSLHWDLPLFFYSESGYCLYTTKTW